MSRGSPPLGRWKGQHVSIGCTGPASLVSGQTCGFIRLFGGFKKRAIVHSLDRKSLWSKKKKKKAENSFCLPSHLKMSGYIKGLPPFCELRQIPFLLSGRQLCHLRAKGGKLDSVFSLLSANTSILWTWVPGSKALVLIFASTYPALLWAGTVLIILHALFHLIFTVTFWGLFYFIISIYR